MGRAELFVDKKSWHARLFFWSLCIWLKFKYGQYWKGQLSKYERQTNLCFYMRTIIVWMPLVLGLHLMVWGALFYVSFILPGELFGFKAFGKFWLFVLLAAALVAAVIFGGIVYEENIEPKIRPKIRSYVRKRKEEKRAAVAAKPPEPKGMSGWEVLITWLVARKQAICPFISFQKEVR